jgi:2-amino-4-hydroxy-6-hydroxymethyldihydropteridine diphosphokinase
VSVHPSFWTPAYVAIGSNLDGPVAQVEAALVELKSLPQSRLIARSRLYRSAPLGPQDQPEFINAVAGLLTQLTARELLRALQQVEVRMGRVQPVVRWGARRIDLDLLVHGDSRIDEEDLTIPHCGVPSRNFVLYPLCDIAPTLLIPGHGRASVLAMHVGSKGLAALK